MEDQVPFKVYAMWDDSNNYEVRRFGIEKSVVTSYHYLNAKLQDLYPGLRGHEFTISWRGMYDFNLNLPKAKPFDTTVNQFLEDTS